MIRRPTKLDSSLEQLRLQTDTSPQEDGNKSFNTALKLARFIKQQSRQSSLPKLD